MLVVVVNLIFLSGFPFEIDKMVNKRFPFHHIPAKPFLCSLCMSFWTEIVYLLVTQQFGIFSLMISLFFAYGSEIIQSVIQVTKELLNVCLGWLMKKISR